MCILIPQVCTTGEVWYKKKEKKVGDIKKKKSEPIISIILPILILRTIMGILPLCLYSQQSLEIFLIRVALWWPKISHVYSEKLAF